MKSTDACRRGMVAALALMMAATAAAPALAGEKLNDSELRLALSGVTVEGDYGDGAPFTETYRANGSIKYSDEQGAQTGTWSIKDGHFCTFYKGMDGGCFVVERDGANCYTFFSADPQTGKIDPLHWTARAWDSAKGGDTCPGSDVV
jgi:hypothetical protein